MKILVVNAGSSSLKYQLIEMDNEEVISKGGIERIGIKGSKINHVAHGQKFEIEKPLADHTEAFNLLIDCLMDKEMGVLDNIEEISAIGHRVCHSGEAFKSSAYVDDEALEILESIKHMAPLHNPAQVACLKSCKKILPNVPNVVVFDTGFHATMPKKAYMWGIPYEDYEEFQIRKYGFHGTSHKFVSQEAIKYLEKIGKPHDKIVTCHLGNGSSLSAVLNGKCIDTSMGYTPLGGVMMGTRSGDTDPTVVELLANGKQMTTSEVLSYLNKKSGFLGVSGVSSDSRDVLAEADNGNTRCQLARDMFSYQCKKFIGSYVAAMNGLDCIVFTAGIGENSWEFREMITDDMEFFGVKIDKELNRAKSTRGNFTDLTAKDSKVSVLLIPTNEEIVIARDTKAIVENLSK